MVNFFSHTEYTFTYRKNQENNKKTNKAGDICRKNLVWMVLQCMEIVGMEKPNFFLSDVCV